MLGIVHQFEFDEGFPFSANLLANDCCMVVGMRS